jgi:hypothetical protein
VRADGVLETTAADPNPDTGDDPMSELKLVYSPRLIMSNAWTIARLGARLFGGRPLLLRRRPAQAWDRARTPAAAAAMRARVRASIASLPGDLRDMEQRLQRWYDANEPRPSAAVVAFPSRRPVVPAIPPPRGPRDGRRDATPAARAAHRPGAYEPDQTTSTQMAKCTRSTTSWISARSCRWTVRLGLLDHAWALLGGNGQPASRPPAYRLTP